MGLASAASVAVVAVDPADETRGGALAGPPRGAVVESESVGGRPARLGGETRGLG